MSDEFQEYVVGRNSVLEALKSGRPINKLLIASGSHQGSVRQIIELARERQLVIQQVGQEKLDKIAAGMRHQGVLAYVSPVAYTDVDDILAAAEQRGEPPFLVLLDGLEDPHNVGAILRTADAAGVHGVLLPKRRSCPLSAVVAKASAGAVEYVPVAQIGNIAQTIDRLKERGIWVIGADPDGTEDYYQADFTGPLLLIVGSEGQGMSRLTKEKCDFLVRIPMRGKIASLNASVACALLLYEGLRQRKFSVVEEI